MQHPLCTVAIVNDIATKTRAAEIAAMSIHQVRRELHITRAEKARLAAREMALVARMEALLHDEAQRAYVVPEYELMTYAGMTPREARDTVARSHVAEAAPVFAEFLADGRTTASHVDVMGRGLTKAGAESTAFLAHASTLASAATSMNLRDFGKLVDQTVAAVRTDDGLSTFQRQCQNTYLRTWTDNEGMTNLRGRFDPISGAAIVNTLERRVEQLFHSGDRHEPVDVAPGIEPNDHRRARALVDRLVRPARKLQSTDDRPISSSHDVVEPEAHARAEVVVHIDLNTLIHGLDRVTATCRTALGEDIPVETVRRLACDAEIIPVVLGGHGVPLDVGRSKRLATVHQRRAFEAMYSTCAIPDCDVPYHRCQIHHIDYWENGGRTDFNNQVPLCSRHHHAVHEGGWTLTLEPTTRQVSFHAPPPSSPDYRCARDQRLVGPAGAHRRTRP